jgi:hypothetical protein
MVKEAVHAHWNEKLRQAADGKTFLQFLNIDNCSLGKLHMVWEDLEDQLSIRMVTVKPSCS